MSRLLKYLCKYVNEGADNAKIIFERLKKGQNPPTNKETNDIDADTYANKMHFGDYLALRYITIGHQSKDYLFIYH